MIHNLSIDKQKAANLRDFRETVLISSNFSFAASHFGLRPKAIHVLLAPSGAGKTTLVTSFLKSLLIDPQNTEKKLKFAVLLSEESISDAEMRLSDMGIAGNRVSSIDFMSEVNDSISELQFFEYLEFVKPDVLIYDNLTTSKLYGEKFDQQTRFITKLKEIINTTGTALFAVAHTNNVSTLNNDKLITKEDIRGTKTTVNLAEFFYILQPVYVGNQTHVILMVEKHRGYEMKNKIFSLMYNPLTKTIERDYPIDFNSFKELFKSRNTLKGK